MPAELSDVLAELKKLVLLQEKKIIIPDDLKSQRPKIYSTITIDLSSARTNKELPIAGNYIKVVDSTASSANLDMRFNEPMNDTVNLVKGRVVTTPFYRLFLTNAAQAGETLTLHVGALVGEFDVRDDVGFVGDVNVTEWGGTSQTGFDFNSVIGTINDRLLRLWNGYEGDEGTPVIADNTATNATAIIHTVTAGKTLVIKGSWLTGSEATINANLHVRDASDVHQYYLVRGRWNSGGPSPFNREYPYGIQVPANYDVCVQSEGAALVAYGGIDGYEF